MKCQGPTVQKVVRGPSQEMVFKPRDQRPRSSRTCKESDRR